MMKPLVLSAAICAALVPEARATEIRVTVSNINDAGGRIGCALHSADTDFPMGDNAKRMIWLTPTGSNAVCVFEDVTPGIYAVSVANDLNGNKATDTNALGIPTEEWGVSRNVRPAFRAPRFSEAAFDVNQAPVALNVDVD